MQELMTPEEYEKLRVKQAYPAQPYQIGDITSSTVGLYVTDGGVKACDCIILNGKPHTAMTVDSAGYREYLPDVIFSPAWSSYVTVSEFSKLCCLIKFFALPKMMPIRRVDVYFHSFILKCLEARHQIIHNEDENMDRVVSKLLGQYVDYGTIFLLKDS